MIGVARTSRAYPRPDRPRLLDRAPGQEDARPRSVSEPAGRHAEAAPSLTQLRLGEKVERPEHARRQIIPPVVSLHPPAKHDATGLIWINDPVEGPRRRRMPGSLKFPPCHPVATESQAMTKPNFVIRSQLQGWCREAPERRHRPPVTAGPGRTDRAGDRQHRRDPCVSSHAPP
jgi:hypothetical protein